MLGPAVTVNCTPLLATPPTVTTTFPVVAPVGTFTAMLVEVQVETAAAVPLKVTALAPWLAPKFAPEIVTDVPAGPEVWFRLVIDGLAPPPPPAALNAASPPPQLSDAPRH